MLMPVIIAPDGTVPGCPMGKLRGNTEEMRGAKTMFIVAELKPGTIWSPRKVTETAQAMQGSAASGTTAES